MLGLLKKISTELSLKEFQVSNCVKLLFDEQCTIPFVARYRKEMTGSLDEVVLRNVRDRWEYLTELEGSKTKYLKVIEEQGKLTPELKRKIETCEEKQALEDLYLPFKPKRRTRAQVAKEKGLEPLLEKILATRAAIQDLLVVAVEWVTPKDSTIDAALRVESAELALVGAADILAERISETAEIRSAVRQISMDTGYLSSKKIESDSPASKAADSTKTPGLSDGKTHRGPNPKDDASKYQNYFEYREPILSAPSHRVMAVRRGEAEKFLRVGIDVDTANIIQAMTKTVVGEEPATPVVRQWMTGVVEESYKRLLSPSIETEMRMFVKGKAEEEAIRVFAKNLQNLLMLPPIPGKSVMGVDPGLRTGCKIAVVSDTGKLLAYTTVHPDIGKPESERSLRAGAELESLLRLHKVECISLGNGTGSREIDAVLRIILKKEEFKAVKKLVVNEAGASVYSADDVAREEFPDLDATIRSAVSIARRLQDPLAELVKIDPRSIGVGQYQHDVNVNKLKSSLEEVVESCVNRVGVNLNTASYKLLGYVSGIGPTIAKNIVTTRDKLGKFTSRAQIMEVAGFGPKVFQQSAGFLRVKESANPLDNSSVHPERYEVVQRVLDDLKLSLGDILGNKSVVDSIPFERYVTDAVGMPTLLDIASELVKPGRDPREDGARLLYSDDVSTLEDLKPGMALQGTVTNVTNFGAFVDIGVHQDGLVHISELSNEFVKDPGSVVSVGDIVNVKVLEVDMARRRISLTCKTARTATPSAQVSGGNQPQNRPSPSGGGPRPQGGGSQPNRPGNSQQGRPQQGGHRDQRPRDKTPQPSYSIGDLLSKFNGK